MTTVPNGIIGGILAAVVAAGLTRLIAGDRSGRNGVPISWIGDSTKSRWWMLGLSVTYGAVAGGALLLLELYMLDVLGVPPSVLEAFGTSVLWSAILCVVVLAARRLVPNRLRIATVRKIVAFHALYGLGLGLWIRLTWIT